MCLRDHRPWRFQLHWNRPPTLHQQYAIKIQQSGRSAPTSEGCPSFIHQLWPFYPYVLSLKCPCPPAVPLAACTSQTQEFFSDPEVRDGWHLKQLWLKSGFPHPRIKQANSHLWITVCFIEETKIVDPPSPIPRVLLRKLTLHTKMFFSPGFAL